ncbi:restriction endonuclease subunit S [Providencia stuartii]
MMNKTKVKDIFHVAYGSNLELNSLDVSKNGINFVSRTSKNNGVSSKVNKIPGLPPLPPNVLSVACGGSVLETFLQEEPFYSGRDIIYLKPKTSMRREELLFYAYCIRLNKYRYNYGRQANKSIGDLHLPERPDWIYSSYDTLNKHFDRVRINASRNYNHIEINTFNWKDFQLDEIFDITRGSSHYIKNIENGKYPYISATSENNGCSNYCSISNGKGNSITVSYDGSVGEAFYQPVDFYASEKIAILTPKAKYKEYFNKYNALFICTILRQEKFKYNYGRKWAVNSKLKQTKIKLPINHSEDIDWIFMSNYIKNIPFSL